MSGTSTEDIAALAPPRLIPAVSLRAAGLAATAGIVSMGCAWYQTTSTVDIQAQSRWMNLALVGVSVVWLAIAFAVVTARRSVATRTRRVAAHLTGRRASTNREAEVYEVSELVASPNMVRYHRSTCRLAVGKGARSASRSEHEAAGRLPCGMCEA